MDASVDRIIDYGVITFIRGFGKFESYGKIPRRLQNNYIYRQITFAAGKNHNRQTRFYD